MNTWNVWLGAYLLACVAWALACSWHSVQEIAKGVPETKADRAQFGAFWGGAFILAAMMLALKLIFFW